MTHLEMGETKSHSDIFGDKIVKSIENCQNIGQFEGIMKMIELFEKKFKCKFPERHYVDNKFYKSIIDLK